MAPPSKHSTDDPSSDGSAMRMALGADEVLRLENANLKVQNSLLQIQMLQTRLQQEEAIRQQVGASIMLDHGIPERDITAGLFGIDLTTHEIVPSEPASGPAIPAEEPHSNGVSADSTVSG